MSRPEAFRAACVQLTSSNDRETNLTLVSAMAREAVEHGVNLVMFPENVLMMEPDRLALLAKAMPEDRHVGLRAFRALARDLRAWIHCGTLDIRLLNGKAANRSYVLAPDGSIAARYDKIHMFDVRLGNGESYAESATNESGRSAEAAELPWGRLGLTVCYDLRFPQLFRHLAQAGSDFIVVPAAFTQTTGEAHWHVLLRARAIETGCFIFAPGQTGTNALGRESYGHSLIVDPWGTVLADAGTQPGIIYSWIDRSEVTKARERIPSLALEAAYERLPTRDGALGGTSVN